MPTFSTPEPVALRIRTQAGEVNVTASDRTDTVVDVAPTNPASDADVEHAAATTVEQRGGEIIVSAPDTKRFFGRTPSVDVTVGLPAGSRVGITTSSADVRVHGATGQTDVETASGDVSVEHADSANIVVASGDVSCDRIDGTLAVKSASGEVRFGEAGAASVQTASADVVGTEVGGDLEVRTAAGDVTVDRVHGSVAGQTASGDLRVGSVARGAVEVKTASGDIRIGVAGGSAAWLDVHSLSGDVSSALDQSGPPDDEVEVVSVHARTLSGDIAIVRALH